MKIVRQKKGDFGFSQTTIGGNLDGEEFKLVEVEMEDGSSSSAWVSNARSGFYRHAFVPYDFIHPQVI